MARQRNIKPGFFTNDKLSDCSPLARILFAGLWCIADREGRLENRTKRIKAHCLPYDDCEVPTLLQELAPEFITLYELSGTHFIQINAWKAHQTPHKNETQSLIPQPTPTTPKKSRTKRSGSGVTPESVEVRIPSRGVETETETETEIPEGGCKGETPAAQVEAVVDHYRTYHPKARPGRADREKILARLREDWTVDELKGAIDGNHRDPWCCGENKDGKHYHALELCMRDAKHVQQYLEIPIVRGPVLSEKTRRTVSAAQSWLERKEREDDQLRQTTLLEHHGGDGERVPAGGGRADAGRVLDGTGGIEPGPV